MNTENERLVVFREFNSIIEAEIVKSALDRAGIWSMIDSEYMSMIYPMAIMPRIMVRQEDLDVIKSLIPTEV